MQNYGELFARVYDKRWGAFAETVSPKLADFLNTKSTGPTGKSLLDICCGTGQLSLHFLERGYYVAGLDKSRSMLRHAREKVRKFLDTKRAVFVHGDAESFSLDRKFSFAVSTFDALNHLENIESLGNCFTCVKKILHPEGVFVFDINTKIGLKRWASLMVQDDEEMTIINRGIFTPDMTKAYNQATGFVRNSFGMYDKFNESFYNTVFSCSDVKRILHNSGFRQVYCADISNLDKPVSDPEKLSRVYFIAKS